MVGDEDVEQPPRRVRQPSGPILAEVVGRPLPAADDGIERGKEVERDQDRPPLEELAVIHLAAGRQRVLQLPGEPDPVVVVRAAGPVRIRAPDHGLPEARQALREPVEGRAAADRVHEREGAPGGADPAAGEAAEVPVAPPEERPSL